MVGLLAQGLPRERLAPVPSPSRDNSVLWASPVEGRLATTEGRIEFTKCYGLAVHLQLLSTPPHGDAVTFSYQVHTKPGRGLAPR